MPPTDHDTRTSHWLAKLGNDPWPIETGIKARVQDAADFAQSSPEPDERELWTDILVEA